MNNTMVLLTKQNSGVCQALLLKSYNNNNNNDNNNNNNRMTMRNLTQQKFELRFEYSIKMSI